MRVLCCVVLLLAGAVSAQAQPGHERGKARADRAGVPGATSLGANSKRIEASAAAPDFFDVGLRAQLLPSPFRMPNTQLETVNWAELDGWASDDHAAAFATFINSCKTVVRGTPPRHAGQPFYAALQSACRRALTSPRDAVAAKTFFETNFRPMRIAPLGENNGFITGYYEPIVVGARVASAEFNVPLYRTPPNLSKPSYQRAAIEDGALAGRKLEICWLKDPTDLFFAQIQGSARIKLVEDGKVLRLNYSGHNGWPYTPVGRILIARNIVPKEEMSMQRIREWIEANPKEGKELRRRNKSFVFFRETGLAEHEEPVGAQGISLTPGRSIAVDKSIHVYGTPFFIAAELPLDGDNSENGFQRLMVSQDTGGAIIGPARADLYFGAGDGAAAVAGRLRHPGQFTMLIPRDIDPVIAGWSTPLPRPRPAFGKPEDKINVAAEKPARE